MLRYGANFIHIYKYVSISFRFYPYMYMCRSIDRRDRQLIFFTAPFRFPFYLIFFDICFSLCSYFLIFMFSSYFVVFIVNLPASSSRRIHWSCYSCYLCTVCDFRLLTSVNKIIRTLYHQSCDF